jgi:uncharacterized membrane protein YdbT with pleckstrin-like domain
MEIVPVTEPPMIVVRPATLFAFIKVFPFIICALGFLLLAWRYYPALALLSLVASFMGCYRFFYIRNCIYTLTPEVIKITRGLLFKRTDQVELFRVKDYVQTQPFLLQLFGLMDLMLRTTDPVNPVIWLRGIPLSDIVDTIRAHVLETRQHNRIYEIN